MRRLFFLSSCVLAILAACVGDDPAGSSGGPLADGGPGNGTSNADGGDGGADCLRCADPTNLAKCDGTTEACTFGCATTGGAHCAQVYPSGLVTLADVAPAGVTALTVSGDLKFSTDTGLIEPIRGANTDPLIAEVKDGIGFRLAVGADGKKVAIWTFDALTVPASFTLRFTAANPVALVAAKAMSIVGIVDARGYGASLCSDTTPGPGGFPGGASSAAGGGPGGGSPPTPLVTFTGGAGGGGHAGLGGKGGPGQAGTGGDGGAAYGDLLGVPLVGGSGGAGSPASAGGGGGGAIQLVAPLGITIGGGASPGGVNAGGCNGANGGFGNSGGAGGSGGTVLIETRTLTLDPNGYVAVCGGGGATGGSGTAPTPGQLTGGGSGGSGATGYGFGGSGGCNNLAAGGGGASSVSNAGGSAGGSTGRIRINNRSGTLTPPNGALQPALGINPNPPTTVGTLDVH